MECDIPLRKPAVKRNSEKHLLRNAFVAKSGNMLKSEFPMVLRMTDQTAAFGAKVFQS
jgi:RNase P protein component